VCGCVCVRVCVCTQGWSRFQRVGFGVLGCVIEAKEKANVGVFVCVCVCVHGCVRG